MKALTVDHNLRTEFWGKLKGGVFGRSQSSELLNFQSVEVPEPGLPNEDWVRIRSVASCISDFEEGLLLDSEPLPMGGYIGFPYVPGNENLGLIIDRGSRVTGLEIGERVIVNPLLSCVTRGVAECPACIQGKPQFCSNFDKGNVGPGMMIGACKETMGGWADSFVAHQSQVRTVPQNMDSDTAVLVPSFARALRAVLQNKPNPQDRVVVLGGGSAGILLLHAITLLGIECDIFVVVENAVQAGAIRDLYSVGTVPEYPEDYAVEVLAKHIGSCVRIAYGHRPVLDDGADLVFETTGSRTLLDLATRIVGNEKKLVLMSPRNPVGLNLEQLWLKGINVRTSLYSGAEIGGNQTIDVALALSIDYGLPRETILTHHFPIGEFQKAFSTIRKKSDLKLIKAVFQHVV